MKFNDYMKKSRERNDLTQEAAATQIDVTVQTIQNWEKETLPDSKWWDKIIKTYKLNKEEFSKNYMDSVTKEETLTEKGSFPEFLYPNELLDKIKGLVLTEEEQELLGLLTIYGDLRFDMPRIDGNEDYHFEITQEKTLAILPYEYVKQKGSFYIMALNNKLNNKLGRYKQFVINRIIENPSKIFNINNLSSKDYFILCDYININGEGTLYNYYKTLLNLLYEIEKDKGKKVFERTNGVDSYTKNINWEHAENELLTQKIYSYKQYISIIQEECDDEDYTKEKEQYKKDLEFYNEHFSMVDRAPVPPTYKGIRYVIINEKGKQLLEWHKTIK